MAIPRTHLIVVTVIWLTAYLGTQGYQWDAQQDMALATGGAALSMLILRFKVMRSHRAR
jgi:uncharacterized membrane protein YjdF